eukprot:SAG22_NODE_2510_length_2495_cov_8.480384_1_plen_581_part_00
MDEKQRYKFDCTGWLALDRVLDGQSCAELLRPPSASESPRAHTGGDLEPAAVNLVERAQRTVLRHPAVQGLLDDLFENGWGKRPGAVSLMQGVDGYRVDRPPRLMGVARSRPGPASASAGPTSGRWRGGAVRADGGRSELSLAREYTHRHGERHCQGLLLVVALEDTVERADDGFAFVPCSHQNEVPPPAALFGGGRGQLPHHTIHCPAMQQGTVLLLAPTLLRRLPARPVPLLCIELASNSARPTPGGEASQQQRDAGWKNFAADGDEQRPPWAGEGELDELQAAVLERAAMPHDDRVVIRTSSDGQRAWVETKALSALSELPHPAAPWPVRSVHEERDALEKWLFDLQGFLVVPGLFDARFLAEANAVLDAEVAAAEDRLAASGGPSPAAAAAASSVASGSRFDPAVPDAPKFSVGDLFSLKGGLFRKLIAMPPVLHRLGWMLGDGYRQAGEPRAICYSAGSGGHGLHSGTLPATPGNSYAVGLTHSLNVAFQLRDATATDGGFVAIPGSQRAAYPTPASLMQSDREGSIQHVEAPAGSAILFNGGATAHGAWGWTGTEGRRAIIVNYLSKYVEYPRF